MAEQNHPNQTRRSDQEDRLTPREKEVFELIGRGLDNAEIAEQLVLSPKTVKWYTRQIYQKLNVHSRQAAIDQARQAHLKIETRTKSLTSLAANSGPLIGREKELHFIQQRLEEGKRILTITGPGGVGKTRLVLEAGRLFMEKGVFADGVFFTDLTALREIDQIEMAIADALRYHLEVGSRRRSPRQQLINYFRVKKLLLILDNLEHLSAGVDFIVELLQNNSELKIVVTSRERIHLRQEQVLPLQGLPFAGENEVHADLSPEAFHALPAIQLFIRCASRVWPEFSPEFSDLPQINRICRLVDGIPLAIELAAAWVDKLLLADIAAELFRDLDFLQSEMADLPPRHQSLRAVFDASWSRLEPEEQGVLARLSVFRNGFTLQAGRKIAGAMPEDLGILIDKSLLRLNNGSNRYELHEQLRQYAAERLHELEEDRFDKTLQEVAVKDRHSAYYCAALGDRLEDLHGRDQQAGLASIERDIGNIRAAWLWAIRLRNLTRLGKGMDALGLFCEMRGRYEEGRSFFQPFEEMLGEELHSSADLILVCALTWQSVFQRLLGRLPAALACLNIADDFCKRTAPPALSVPGVKAFYYLQRGHVTLPEDFKQAESFYWTSLEESRNENDRWGQAAALAGLAQAAYQLGQLEEAEKHWQACLPIRESLGDQIGQVATLSGLCEVCRYQGRFTTAKTYANRAVELAYDFDNRLILAESLEQLGISTFYIGSIDDVQAKLYEALSIYKRLAIYGEHSNIYVRLSLCYMAVGHYRQALATAQQALADSEERGNVHSQGLNYLLIGQIHFLKDELDFAAKFLEKGLSLMTAGGGHTEANILRCYLAAVRYRLGEQRRAFRLICLSLQGAIEDRNFFGGIHVIFILTLIWGAEGDWEAAANTWYILRDRQPWTSFTENSLIQDLLGGLRQRLNDEADRLSAESWTLSQRQNYDIWPAAEATLARLDKKTGF